MSNKIVKFFKWFGISIGVLFLIVVILSVLFIGIMNKKVKYTFSLIELKIKMLITM